VELVKSNAAGELCYVLETDEKVVENSDEPNTSLLKDADYGNVLIVEDKLFAESAEVSGTLSVQEKVSLLRRFVNWLHVDTEDETSVLNDIEKFEIEASPDSNQDSEGDVDMDIDILKDALGAVVDEKLSLFKEELKSDTQTYVDEKLDSVAKSVEVEEAEVVEAEVDSSVLDAAIAKFREELDGATATIQEQKDALSDASAKIEQLETAGAIKKSVESDEEMVEDEIIAKTAGEPTFWDNLYLPQELIKAFGYEK
jgi:phosphoglycerate-specific signal transduction histidine kinase